MDELSNIDSIVWCSSSYS